MSISFKFLIVLSLCFSKLQAALPEISSSIRTAFARTLTVAEHAHKPRPIAYRHFFELLKFARGWSSTSPEQITNPSYEGNSHQIAVYRYLADRISIAQQVPTDDAVKIKVGTKPFNKISHLLSSSGELAEIFEDNGEFLDGYRVNFDFRPSFPIVLANLRAAANPRVHFGLLLEDAFRCRTVRDYRKYAALMNFWDPREHVTLFVLPAGKRVIGTFGLVGPQSSYEVLNGQMHPSHDFLTDVLEIPENLFKEEDRKILRTRATESFDGGALQFYIYAAEESHVCDLGGGSTSRISLY
jgi:hypothetical protein